jgi:hypothetical protein
MISVHGTYQHGAVVLDEPADFPEGAHVRVTLDDEAIGQRAEPLDICCDGTPWDDSPEGRRKWLAWFDSLEPVFTDKEYEHLQSTLRTMREEQKPSLETRARMVDSLFH